jgi:hypothetical protein
MWSGSDHFGIDGDISVTSSVISYHIRFAFWFSKLTARWRRKLPYWPLFSLSDIGSACHHHVGCYAPNGGCYATSSIAAGGCQYLAVKNASNTEAFSATSRSALGTKVIWLMP